MEIDEAVTRSDLVHERLRESPVRRWMLLDSDRYVITGLFSIVATVVTFVFLPFVVLLVYTFRIATIASRTADFGPFVPRVDFDE